jgi:hypothetical protein
LSKKHVASNQELTDENSSRPNLADIPKMDDMLALYEKVLAEIDADIANQQEFSKSA